MNERRREGTLSMDYNRLLLIKYRNAVAEHVFYTIELHYPGSMRVSTSNFDDRRR